MYIYLQGWRIYAKISRPRRMHTHIPVYLRIFPVFSVCLLVLRPNFTTTYPKLPCKVSIDRSRSDNNTQMTGTQMRCWTQHVTAINRQNRQSNCPFTASIILSSSNGQNQSKDMHMNSYATVFWHIPYGELFNTFQQELCNVKVWSGAIGSPHRNKEHLHLAINHSKRHSRVISCMVLGIRAYGDHLLGTLNA